MEQEVPFPIDDIVWDHQFIGATAEGDTSAMIVAAKLYFGTSKFLFEVPYPDGINAVGLNDMWSLHFSYRAASQ